MIIEQDGAAAGGGPGPGGLIKDADTASFVADVVERSKTVPVIVVFRSPQSESCNQLIVTLEKLVTLGGGIVRMVKVIVEENQQLTAQLQVQSVPTVFGFKHGQPVDAFVGAQPEAQIKTFIKRLAGDAKAPIEEALEKAKALLDDGEPGQARAMYAEILGREPSSGAATAGLIRCYLASGEADRARALVEGLDAAALDDGDVQAAITALELAEAGAAGGDSGEFRAKLAADENDHQARLDLALSLYGAGDAEAALEELLEIIRRDRAWNDEEARKQMLKIFEALGATDPVTAAARRALSTVLFS